MVVRVLVEELICGVIGQRNELLILLLNGLKISIEYDSLGLWKSVHAGSEEAFVVEARRSRVPLLHNWKVLVTRKVVLL